MATAEFNLPDSPLVPAGFPADWSLADLQAHLGDIPPERIRLRPPPGTATEVDWMAADRAKVACELVDGVLVNKTMGIYENELALIVARILGTFVVGHQLGKVFGERGPMRVLPAQIREPDVAFVAWETLRAGRYKELPFLVAAPDLAVEILSPTNTRKEMDRKLVDYFAGGTKLVWFIDPSTRTAQAFTAPTAATDIPADGFLPGGNLLPGLAISLAALFAEADRLGPAGPG